MLIYMSADGQAKLITPQHVYQGSSVTSIQVIAPFPSTASMTIAFTLPDGTPTPQYVMTLVANQPDDLPTGVFLWEYVMPFALTQNAGQANIAFLALFATGASGSVQYTQQTSAQVKFTIEQSVVGTLPDEPTPDAWAQVLSAISALTNEVQTFQSDITDIENGTTVVGKATADADGNNIPDTYATKQEVEAVAETAQSASESATQAVATATAANQTAEEAKELAQQVVAGNGTAVSVGGVIQASLSFDEDPQTQITQNAEAVAAVQQSVDALDDKVTTAESDIEALQNSVTEVQSDITDIENGTTPVGNANQLGGTDAASYAKLAQVVRTDAAQSLTTAEKQQARQNINALGFIGEENPDNALLNNLVRQYFVQNATTGNPTSGSGWLLSGGSGSQNYGAQLYLDDANNLMFRSKSVNWKGWEKVFKTDPTALTPSTANGWTQIGIKSDLPSEGTYYVYPSISGSVKLYGIATVVFDGTNSAFGATGGNFILNIAYIPTVSTKWSFIFANGTELTPDYILFKRIN